MLSFLPTKSTLTVKFVLCKARDSTEQACRKFRVPLPDVSKKKALSFLKSMLSRRKFGHEEVPLVIFELPQKFWVEAEQQLEPRSMFVGV